jgi:DNA-binding MarR family transcriptional regulator
METTTKRPVPAREAPTRENLGFRLAKASQRWNELIHQGFSARGYPEVRPAYGSILVPLFEEDHLRMGELARRARLAKQTMTTMVRLLERDGLVSRSPDPTDGRAFVVSLTPRAKEFAPAAAAVLRELDELVAERLTETQRSALHSALKEVIRL